MPRALGGFFLTDFFGIIFSFFLQDHTHRANRNWELWDEDWGLLSPRVAVLAVAVLGGGMALPLLPGLLLRRVP